MDSKKQPSAPNTPDQLSMADTQPAKDELNVKNEIGNFEIRREVGRGGMGTVYEAWEPSLQRAVALKILARHVASSATVVRRFQREAQAAAKLHHMHIVPIFAQGEENDTYYYAMEYIDGPSLHAVITNARDRQISSPEPADLDETVALVRPHDPVAGDPAPSPASSSTPNDSYVLLYPPNDQESAGDPFDSIARHMASIADALDYAHRHGIVHRDVKPHNLLFGTDGRLRIADFGLAQIAEQPGVTVTGEVLGSPLYMSPEQILEGPSSVDHRTDIYSLGATMYEWLTLQPPYPGETREQIIQRITTAEPKPLRTLNPRIPVDLETVCLKAIARDRHRRYQNAADLRDDLKRFLQDRPIKARRASLASRLGKAVLRNRLAVLSGAAAVIVIALSWALHTSQSQVRSQAADVAEALQEKEQLLELVNRMRPVELGGALGLAEAGVEALVETGQSVTSFLIDESRDAGLVDLGSPPGIATRALEDLYADLKPVGGTESADDDPCAAAALDAAGARDAELEDSRRLINKCLDAQADHFEARLLSALVYGRLQWYDSMLDEANELIKLRNEDSRAYLWLGLARVLLGQVKEAVVALDRARQLDPSSAWPGTLRALALIQANRPTDAVVDLAEALNRAPNLPVALLARAAAHAMVGNLNSAIADLTTVIQTEPENTALLRLRGDHHVRLGDFDAAIDDYTRAIGVSGQTPALLARLAGAKVAQYNEEKAREAAAESDDAASIPAEGAPDGHAPGWFSRFRWPRAPERDSEDATAPDAEPD